MGKVGKGRRVVAAASVGCRWSSAAVTVAAELRRDSTEPTAGWWAVAVCDVGIQKKLLFAHFVGNRSF